MAPPSSRGCWRLRFLPRSVPHGGRAYLAEQLAPLRRELGREPWGPPELTALQKICFAPKGASGFHGLQGIPDGFPGAREVTGCLSESLT